MAADIIVLALVFGYGGYVMYHSHKRKKAGGGCCGTCSSCHGCAASHDRPLDNERLKSAVESQDPRRKK